MESAVSPGLATYVCSIVNLSSRTLNFSTDFDSVVIRDASPLPVSRTEYAQIDTPPKKIFCLLSDANIAIDTVYRSEIHPPIPARSISALRSQINPSWGERPRCQGGIDPGESQISIADKRNDHRHRSRIQKSTAAPQCDPFRGSLYQEISGIAYQQSELAGYEVRKYPLSKWGRKCAYCSKIDIPLQIGHIIPKSPGGVPSGAY